MTTPEQRLRETLGKSVTIAKAVTEEAARVAGESAKRQESLAAQRESERADGN